MDKKIDKQVLVNFFHAVQQAAEAHGIGAYAIAGVLPLNTEGEVREVQVAAHASTHIESASDDFTEGYCQAMVDALDEALSKLSDGEGAEVTEYKN